jgi:hypothetical protein
VRWSLVELEEMTVDEAFDGLVPAFEVCTTDNFDELVETLASQRKVEHPSITRARRLLEDDLSLDRLWQELNECHPTSQTVIEAIMHCVRERGPAALEEPANIERLTRCGAAAQAEINQRIAQIKGTTNDHQHS